MDKRSSLFAGKTVMNKKDTWGQCYEYLSLTGLSSLVSKADSRVGCAFLESVRLGWKGMPGANTLAYSPDDEKKVS
jgi:hypothetical protein